MILRKWEVRPLDKERAAAFAQTYGVPFFLAMLMNIRGLDDAAHLREFLGEGEPLSDPFLLKDMDKAAARITRAVDNMEIIAVYRDYGRRRDRPPCVFVRAQSAWCGRNFYVSAPQREAERPISMNIGAKWNRQRTRRIAHCHPVDNGISSVQGSARRQAWH